MPYDQPVLFCQSCGHFQRVQGELQPCEDCGRTAFANKHPSDRDSSWTLRWQLTMYDRVVFLPQLNISAE
jgi:hypothetical protein